MRLMVKDLLLQYVGLDKPSLVIDNLQAECPLAVLGWGGDGKTNLLRVLAGVETIKKGEIYFNQTEVGLVKPKARSVALISADTPLFENKTALFNLEFPLKKRRLPLNACAVGLHIKNVFNKKVRDLDEKTRIDLMLTRALLRDPDLILIDEPAAFCTCPDYFVKRAGEILVKDKLVLATFDYDLTSDLCENFVVLRRGAVVFYGNKAQLLACDNEYVKSFLR